ncbi:MAG: hypothetical protein Q4D74_07265 [Comamonadaceae bacterium]|nr:hypothetical protein [Comamonadaceae bacterium]RRD58895.1 hypothetical protein EII20_00030 [Comamonadaceae bacterium OH2545_COT-014]
MKKLPSLAALALGLSAAVAQAACYTVMDAKGNIISQSPNPPVNMAYQLHQTVPYKYGKGATMSFGVADDRCGDEVDTWYDGVPRTQLAKAKSAARKKGKKRRAVRRARAASALPPK